MLHPEFDDAGSDIYEIERVIGRRVSVLKTEYLVFWKGYNYNDCTWEPLDSNDESCAQAIDDFEQACSKLRIARRTNPEIAPIDRYENEGVATLIDEALVNIQPDTSAFANAVEDFHFASAEAEKPGMSSPTLLEPQNNSKKSNRPYRRMVAATVGWHRMRDGNGVVMRSATGDASFASSDALRSSIRELHIAEIGRSLRVSSGQIFYLARWSDGQLSWESPSAFTRYIDILTKYENDHFARKRTDLVKQYRQAKQKGNMSIVTTTPRRTNLERMVGSTVTNSIDTVMDLFKSPLQSAAASSSISSLLKNKQTGSKRQSAAAATAALPSLFDLSTSNLLQKKNDAKSAVSGNSSRFDLFDRKDDGNSMDIDNGNADTVEEDLEVVVSGVVLPQPSQSVKHRHRALATDPDDQPLINTLSRDLSVDSHQKPAKKKDLTGLVPFVVIDTPVPPSLASSMNKVSGLIRFESERRKAIKMIYQQYPSFRKTGRISHVDSVSLLMDDMSLSTGKSARHVVSVASTTSPDSLISDSSEAEHQPAADDDDHDFNASDKDEEEGFIRSSDSKRDKGHNGVTTAGRNGALDANKAVDSSKCDFCAKPLVDADNKVVSCNKCHMSYHAGCYDKVAMRNEIDLLQLQDKSGSCVFCAKFGRREVMTCVTWRGAPRIGTVKFADVDILVKWKGFSYRELSWIPFIWHLKCNRFGSMVLRHKIAANIAPPLVEDIVKPAYLEPGLILDVTRCVASMKNTRVEALESSGISLDRSKWELYTDFSRVQVAWKELNLDEATWEKIPNPVEDPKEYEKWFKLFEIWKQSDAVSLSMHMRIRPRLRSLLSSFGQFKEVKEQPKYLQGGQMYSYQLEGANWLYYQWWQGKSAILADDPGLGKTIQTIAFLSIIYHLTLPKNANAKDIVDTNEGTFPFLIVVPTTLIDNWVSEFRKWAPFLSVATLSGNAKNRDIQLETTVMRDNDLKCHVLITSYETISKAPVLSKFSSLKISWEAIIYDEGHRLKNDQTKTYKALAKLRSRQRVILTGTPLQNDIRELFNVVGFVDPTARAEMQDLETSFDVNETQSVDNVRKKLREYMLRRSKNDVELLVPPKHELILPVSMSSLQRNLYKATLTKNVRLLESISSVLHRSNRRANGSSTSDSESSSSSKPLATFMGSRQRIAGNIPPS
ncbi:hypothetical protein J3B02_003447, partial [Coemansia erecta]